MSDGVEERRPLVLTINGGSSSLKFAVFRAGPIERWLSGRVERIGLAVARLVVRDGEGRRIEDRPVDAPDQASAAELVIDRLGRDPGIGAIAAVGHRVVHGGGRFVEPGLVTAEM